MSQQTLHRHSSDFILDVKSGIVKGHEIINKFGSSDIVNDSTFTVIAHGGKYQVPTTAQSLEFVSNNIGDALNGVGMFELTIIGLNGSYEKIECVVPAHATNGTLAVAIPDKFIRVYSAYVSASGTYATLTSPSHLGTITIQSIGGADVWAKIDSNLISHGQTQIGVFTTAKNYDAYIGNTSIHTESSKPVSVFGFKREGANIITPPYDTMRAFTEIIGIEGSESPLRKSWLGPFPEYTDFGHLALGSTPSLVSCSIDFEILLIQKT